MAQSNAVVARSLPESMESSTKDVSVGWLVGQVRWIPVPSRIVGWLRLLRLVKRQQQRPTCQGELAAAATAAAAAAEAEERKAAATRHFASRE